MENVKMQVKGDVLTITVDLSHDGGMSGSGKSQVIATTRGNKPVPNADGAIIGLNIYRKA